MQKKHILPLLLLINYVALVVYAFVNKPMISIIDKGFNSAFFLNQLPINLLTISGILLFGITIIYLTEFTTQEIKTHVLLVVVFTLVISIYDILYSFNPASLFRFSFMSSIINVILYFILILQSMYFVKSKENVLLKYLVVLSSLLLFFETGLIPMFVHTTFMPNSMDNIIAFQETYALVGFVVSIIIILLRVATLYKVLDLE